MLSLTGCFLTAGFRRTQITSGRSTRFVAKNASDTNAAAANGSSANAPRENASLRQDAVHRTLTTERRCNSQRFNLRDQFIYGILGARTTDAGFCVFDFCFGWRATHHPNTIAFVINQFDLTIGTTNLFGNISLHYDSDHFSSPYETTTIVAWMVNRKIRSEKWRTMGCNHGLQRSQACAILRNRESKSRLVMPAATPTNPYLILLADKALTFSAHDNLWLRNVDTHGPNSVSLFLGRYPHGLSDGSRWGLYSIVGDSEFAYLFASAVYGGLLAELYRYSAAKAFRRYPHKGRVVSMVLALSLFTTFILSIAAVQCIA